MARVAAVLLIVLVAVSTYAFAVFGGAALARKLDGIPDGVNIGGVVEHFTKIIQELWDGKEKDGGAIEVIALDIQETRVLKMRPAVRRPPMQPERRQWSAVGGADVQPARSNRCRRFPHASNTTHLSNVYIKLGPWGGAGGQPFDMHSSSVSRLDSITIYHNYAMIQALSYKYYEDGERFKSGPWGLSNMRGVRARAEEIKFAPNEQLVAVEGTIGRCTGFPGVVITSLKFYTNNGRRYGPFGGTKEGTPFSIPAASGCIVGFWGRSGWLLDAIGVYVKPCPARRAPTTMARSNYTRSSSH